MKKNNQKLQKNSPSTRWTRWRGGWGVRIFVAILLFTSSLHAQWTQILPATIGTFTYYDMSVIAGANGNDTIFVAGTAGAGKPRLYRSYDGGTTWTSLPFFNYNPHSLSELQSVVAFRSGVVLCSGSNISGSWVYRSTDWGQTWNSSQTKADTYVNGKWGTNDSFTHAGTLFNQWGFSKDEGLTYTFYNNTLGQWAGRAPYVSDSIYYVKKSDGCVYKTVNQGQTWQGLVCMQNFSTMFGHFFNADTGVWCADTYMLRTTDGGASWDTVATIDAYRVHFSEQKGMVWGGSHISFSDDAGLNWVVDTSTIAIGGKYGLYRTNYSAYALGTNALIKKTIVTSNDIQSTSNINIFPNPSSKVIHFQGFKGDESLEIYDLIGKKVLDQKISSEIQHHLESGTFKLVIKDKNNQKISTKTIIIQ